MRFDVRNALSFEKKAPSQTPTVRPDGSRFGPRRLAVLETIADVKVVGFLDPLFDHPNASNLTQDMRLGAPYAANSSATVPSSSLH